MSCLRRFVQVNYFFGIRLIFNIHWRVFSASSFTKSWLISRPQLLCLHYQLCTNFGWYLVCGQVVLIEFIGSFFSSNFLLLIWFENQHNWLISAKSLQSCDVLTFQIASQSLSHYFHITECSFKCSQCKQQPSCFHLWSRWSKACKLWCTYCDWDSVII